MNFKYISLLFPLLAIPSHALICLYGEYCAKSSDCVRGAKCLISSSTYSQCVLDPAYNTCIADYGQCGGENFSKAGTCCSGKCEYRNSYYSDCVPVRPPQCSFPTSRVVASPTASPNNKKKNFNNQICQFASNCRTSADCVGGNKCVANSPYYSQCIPDTTSYRTTNCIHNYATVCSSDFDCCDPGAICNNEPYRQCQQPSIKSGLCINSIGSNPIALPVRISTIMSSKTPSLTPSNQPITSIPTKLLSKIPSKKPVNNLINQKTLTSTTRPSQSPPSPTVTPTLTPTIKSTNPPSFTPTIKSSRVPSFTPTIKSTNPPSLKPTIKTNNSPSLTPSSKPTKSRTIKPSSARTVAPSARIPNLIITISHPLGHSLNIAEVSFFSHHQRVDPALFNFKASSQYGTILGPNTDELGDSFGAAQLANDGDLRSSFRSFYSGYWTPDSLPTLTITTPGTTRIDQIIVYNRRTPKYQRRNDGANIQVAYDSLGGNQKLWSANFVGAQYVYNFTNVFSGQISSVAVPVTAPTASPSMFVFDRILVATISMPNGSSLRIAEVEFFRENKKLSSSLFTFTATTIGASSPAEGGPEYANDGDFNTAFVSDNTLNDDDSNPTLVITTDQANLFESILLHKTPDSGNDTTLVGAKISVFYFLQRSIRVNLWNATISSGKNVYKVDDPNYLLYPN